MLKFCTLLIFKLFLFTTMVSAQNGWELQNELIGEGDLMGASIGNMNDIFFINAANGWAVGADGIILHTKDGGISWRAQVSKTKKDLRKVTFIDSNNGWIVVDDYVNLHTTNGGATWTGQSLYTLEISKDCSFIDAQNGWTLSYDTAPIISRTYDGGNTWAVQYTFPQQGLGISTLFFVDANNGWAVGGVGSPPTGIGTATIARTTNGGSTWTVQTPGNTILEDVTFVNGAVGWAVGAQGTVLKTINGGDTWTAQTSGTLKRLLAVTFMDVNNGWAVGSTGTIIHTVDGGSTWTVQISGTTNELSAVSFTDSNNGWAVGDEGAFLHTTDGGNTWLPQITKINKWLEGVDFSDPDNGWAVGKDGTILRTANGGASWRAQTSGTAAALYDINYIYNPTPAIQTACAVGSGGTILRTVDSGNTWFTQTSGTVKALYSVYFTNGNAGWAVGETGTILKTANGGNNWSAQTSGTTAALRDVFFLNSTTGWSVGTNGTILRTSNGGAAWSTQISGTTQGLNSVLFLDADNGWIAGGNGTILHTTNGGGTWSAQTSGTTQPLQAIAFADANRGWAVGELGTILQTTDGGITWTMQYYGSAVSLTGMTAVDVNNVWAVGSQGIILKNKCRVSGTALSLNGSSQSVNISNIGSYSNVAITYEAWVKPNAITGDHQIIARGNTSKTLGIQFGISKQGNEGKIWVGGNSGGGWNNSYVSNVSTGVWTHLTAVYATNTGEIKVYKNGVLVGTVNNNFTFNGSNFNTYIGRNHASPLQHFNGEIDDVRIWNTARMSYEIDEYTTQLLGNETNLLAYYDMNQTSAATTVVNRVNASANGSSIGSPALVTDSSLPVILPKALKFSFATQCQPVQLKATTGNNYLWTGPNGFSSTDKDPILPSASPSLSGFYELRVEDFAGCRTTAANKTSLSIPLFPMVLGKSGNASGYVTYSAEQSITAPLTGQTNVIGSNAGNIVYQAGKSIEFKPGFQTQAGAVFKAQILQVCNQ